MAKPKVTLKLDPALERAVKNGVIDANTGKDLGDKVVEAMKESIARGVSPVKGEGRFIAYAAQRSSGGSGESSFNKSKYPYSVMSKYPFKKLRPVNLYLGGGFIESITSRAKKNIIEIGHINFPKGIRDLFEAHNEGLNKNVPQRKYLPNKQGDEFVVSIMRLIKDIVSERIKNIIKGSR